MNRNELIATVAGALCAVTAIVVPVYIVSTNSTARLEACVSSGGQYLNIPEKTTMECKR